MAAGAAPGVEPEYARRYDFAAVEQHQPVHRAHELFRARSPAHALRNRQASEQFGDDARQQRGRGRTRPHAPIPQVFVVLFVTLAPESTFFPQAELVSDHRPYIAAGLGFALLLAWAVERAARYAGAWRTEAFTGAVLAWSLVASLVGFVDTFHWSDEVTVWDHAVAVEPGNGRAWVGLAMARKESGDLKDARRAIERARQLLPTNPDVHTALCRIELADGRAGEALAAGTQAVRFGKRLARTHACLAAALEQGGHRADALDEMRRAANLAPNDGALKADVAKATRNAAPKSAAVAPEASPPEGAAVAPEPQAVPPAAPQAPAPAAGAPH